MEIFNLFIPATNQLATDYTLNKLNIDRFFHYNYQDSSDYKKRLIDLKSQPFMRNELADHITQFMGKYPSSDQVLASIDKLRQKDSVVVIGGQQAGVLTGPLYTIHKVISIIKLAEEKEVELGVPVVPVFWIAGEDHDFDEVNHVFIENESKLEKKVYPERVLDKRMVSDVPINKTICLQWTNKIIETLGETVHTKGLLDLAEKSINSSETFIDFFAHIVMELFKEHGLLIVDSGDKELRKLEKEIFTKQIKESIHITEALKVQQVELQNQGYNNGISITDQAANLFFYDETHHERILLEYNQEMNQFVGKNDSVSFTKEQLLEIAAEFPEKLSNNVVTRPLTQEWLFPTLAFIAGPGEILYWAELKKAFELFGLKIPPIVPRLNITLLERDIETDLNDLNLSVEEVLQLGVNNSKEQFYNEVKDNTYDHLFIQMKDQLKQNYEQVRLKTSNEYRGLAPLLEKNETILFNQIDFMANKIEEAQKLKHQVRLNKYDRIANSLKPSNYPQERIWNVFYYLNQYGLTFIDELLKQPFRFDGNHNVVKL
ncbi:bacillithiol biosynthesis cysteine-adding enzyme BshC [Bacillus sp. 31A1R]|uniref:Putative cysteine ligase BshC n=1 Tax=Robertmurraya mangrovi TaxID=3098077 RepID=A0ABU5IU71_9BACI|nr:bacillithiol biosynthesis cysteine-adding enzyme BshC [Bacillus sp. 31A1R]MDZ5470691.1 bacillithiol biosynthesis cysteine-adding enzyme BshC [Bacillus sp. 31A1R]